MPEGIAYFPKLWGTSRMGDNDKAILVSFDRKLTDDELRLLHEVLNTYCADKSFRGMN